MSLVREIGSEIIAQFGVPSRGTWKNVAAHTIPTDAVFNSLNVFMREGKLRNRPGLTLNSDTTFLEPFIGGNMIVTPTEKIILGITRNRVYQLSEVSNTWTSLTITGEVNGTFAANDLSVVDIATLETLGDYYALLANENTLLRQWTNSPRTVTTVTGTNIPKAKSVCISAARVVCLVAPHTLVWSNTINHTVYDATAYAKRAQTGDLGICVRSISALSFVLYKERSIHLARAQAGLDESTAFTFLEPIIIEGPAGIYAVVNVGGSHIYMTRNGRIAMFNGTTYPTWIADGLWLFLQQDIKQSLSHLIRGVYDYRLNAVIFFYPKETETGILRGMVIINLPFKGQDIEGMMNTPSAFLGICEKSVVHACEKRWNNEIDRSMIFTGPLDTQDRSQAYILDEDSNLDEELPFNCAFQTGLEAMPDARHTHVSTETFMERGQRYGAVYIEPVVSDILETAGGTILDTSGQWINLEENPVREYIAFGKQVRFFGLRYSWKSSTRVRYSGTVVYASQNQKYKR